MQIEILNSTPTLVDKKQSIEATLFETIKISNGKIYNLDYHQNRVDRAFKEFFKSKNNLQLQKIINNYPKQGLYRAKLIYNANTVLSLKYYKYKTKSIKNFMLVEMPNINYQYKFLNRDFFLELSTIYSADEFLITQNGFLKDTTIANIALFHTKKRLWHTPKEPLLLGTTLSRYLKNKKLQQKDIHYKDLKKYSKIAFLNAMIEWREFKLS